VLRQDDILRKPITIEDFINAVKNTGSYIGAEFIHIEGQLVCISPTLRLQPRSLATQCHHSNDEPGLFRYPGSHIHQKYF
jgi:hypothetical protein